MPDVPADIRAVLDEGKRLGESVSFIAGDELTDAEANVVPAWWLDAVRMAPADSLTRALDQWQAVLPDLLPKFDSWLRTNGVRVFLGRSSDEQTPLLAYVCTTDAGEALCWIGYPPTDLPHHPSLDLTRTPSLIQAFVSQLHNGFRLLGYGNNGFLASHEWSSLGHLYDVDAVEVVGGGSAPDVNRLVPFFFDFGSSSVCFELTGSPTDSRSGWFTYDGQVKAVDMWVTMDHWLLSLIGA